MKLVRERLTDSTAVWSMTNNEPTVRPMRSFSLVKNIETYITHIYTYYLHCFSSQLNI
jgi:hypothetical protein